MGSGGKRRLLFILLLLLLLSLLPQVLGVGIGVNRGYIPYEDVLQNGYAEETVMVVTESEQPIIGTYQFEGDIAPWLRVEPPDQNFTFSKDSPHELKVIIEPPVDARLEEYSGGIRVLTGDIGRTEGGKIGTATRAAFLIKIGASVSGTEYLECRVGGVRIQDTEEGDPSDFIATVINRGNVRVAPQFDIQIFDQFQTEMIKALSLEMEPEILPTATNQFISPLYHELPPGQYWARIATPLCNANSLITFDVLEPGGILDKGELIKIEAQPWAETGEIIPIKAHFTNLGSRTVSAKLKGTITTREGGKLVKVIDTDPINVLAGETAQFETFFNPVEPGQYIVAGRIHYNKKLTFQKSTIINVNGSPLEAAADYSSYFLVAFIIVVAILLLLIMIAKKRKARRHRLR
jgi:hypothetical protein